MRNQNLEYKKKISKAYDKRSRIYHSCCGGDFSYEEVKFLEEEATWAIEQYIVNSDEFTSESLDRNLLNVYNQLKSDK